MYLCSPLEWKLFILLIGTRGDSLELPTTLFFEKYFPTVGLRVCQRYSIFSAGQLGRNLLKRESVAFSKDLDNVLLTPCLGQPSHDITYNLNH